jgi:crossover junction endodeoxyribonuclease RuvC
MTEKFNGEVLALDLATVTGWCRGCPGEVPTFGSLRFGKPGAPHGKAYRTYRDWLDASILPTTRRVVYESTALTMIFSGRTTIEAMRMLVGYAEITEEVCWDRVEVREARVSDVRSFFIGSNMRRELAKPKTIERCHDLGMMVDPGDHNAADAVALWCYQVSFLRPDLAANFSPLFAKKRG